jgi:hypothetical protein
VPYITRIDRYILGSICFFVVVIFEAGLVNSLHDAAPATTRGFDDACAAVWLVAWLAFNAHEVLQSDREQSCHPTSVLSHQEIHHDRHYSSTIVARSCRAARSRIDTARTLVWQSKEGRRGGAEYGPRRISPPPRRVFASLRRTMRPPPPPPPPAAAHVTRQ